MRIQTKVAPYESYQPSNTNAQHQINRQFEPEDDLFDLSNNVINGFSHRGNIVQAGWLNTFRSLTARRLWFTREAFLAEVRSGFDVFEL